MLDNSKILQMLRQLNQQRNSQPMLDEQGNEQLGMNVSPSVGDYDHADSAAPNDFVPPSNSDVNSISSGAEAPVANQFTTSGKDEQPDTGSEDMATSLPSRSGDEEATEEEATPKTRKTSLDNGDQLDEEAASQSVPKATEATPITNDNTEALKEAQAKADRNMLGVNLLNAGQTIGEAFSRNKFNRDVNKSLEKTANAPVEDIKQQQASKKADLDNLEKMYKTASEAHLRDPNSDISVATRGLMNDLGLNLGNGSSAYDIQQATNIDKLLGVKARTDERLQEAGEKAQSRADAAKDRAKLQQDKIDAYSWNRVLQQARNDKDISTAASSANRLQNSLNTLDKKSIVSPQDLKELQQLTVAVQQLRGGGVHEREERYANSLGLKGTELAQFLTGQMQDVGKNNDILAKMKELARYEVANFGQNLQKRLAFKTAGVTNLLKNHPEYQADLDDLTKAGMGQIVGSTEKGNQPSGPNNLGPGENIHTAGLAPNEIRRQTADGRTAVFNLLTKQFLRYE